MLFCRKSGNVVNRAVLVLIFWVQKLVGANFYAFCNYDPVLALGLYSDFSIDLEQPILSLLFHSLCHLLCLQLHIIVCAENYLCIFSSRSLRPKFEPKLMVYQSILHFFVIWRAVDLRRTVCFPWTGGTDRVSVLFTSPAFVGQDKPEYPSWTQLGFQIWMIPPLGLSCLKLWN